MMEFRRLKIHQLSIKGKACEQGTEKRGMSLSGNQMKAREEGNLPLLARVPRDMAMGAHLLTRRFTDGFPTLGELGDPGV